MHKNGMTGHNRIPATRTRKGAGRVCEFCCVGMDAIFFERQEGQLCAQHCLNNLLQGPIFTAVDLAGHAEQLDEDERATMAEGGVTSPEFLRFMQQPSHNMDDSGYFSVQVIAKALSVWNLQLESLTSPHMKAALDNPTSQQAFICNHESHWLTVRKLGQQWFNLNSLLKKSELISDTYLSLFLHQLQMEGYSIFVVVGALPPCEADQVLSLIRAEPSHLPSSSASSSGGAHQQTSRGRGKRPGPHQFLKQTFSSVLSGKSHPAKRGRGRQETSERKEEQDLQVAMALSASLERSQEQFEIDQQLHLQKFQEGAAPVISGRDEAGGCYMDEEEEEEAAITAAIYASLEGGCQQTTTPEANTQQPGALTTPGTESNSGKTAVEKEDERNRYEGLKSGGENEAEEQMHPASQQELRERRLKYLEQKKS